jgi:O-methyltransferase
MPIGRFMRRVRREPQGRGAATPDDADLVGISADDRAIIERALPHTLTGVARLAALVEAVRHCIGGDVPGAFAECGVWRGGSVLAMILTLQRLGREDRDIHLYDTFEGMTEPTGHDVSPVDPPALETWREAQQRRERPWANLFPSDAVGEAAVRETLVSTGYPADRLHFVRGPVETTLPERAPERVALLRLDTDWYESTRHELDHLYPRLSAGGVLIVDDYGHWEGARRAVDEYFEQHPPRPLLNRIDYTGRIAVKL